MTHPLAASFAEAAQIKDEFDSRPADAADHAARTRELIETHHPKRLRLSVAEVIDETATTKTFRLRRATGGDLPPFAAGQYVSVYVDGTSRPYAMSSSPATLDHYDMTVRRVPGGRVSNLLIDTLTVGDPVTTSGPMGTFHHNPLFHGDDVIFLAGGSGVVPAMSMIRDIVDNRLDRRFHLLYGSRTADDVIFDRDLADLAAAHPNIVVHRVIQDPASGWEGQTGFIDAELITTVCGRLAGRMIYVCGPQQFYPFALRELESLNQPRHRIRFEANGAPEEPTSQSHWPSDVDADEEVTVTVRDRSFRTKRGRPLLDALEDNGVRPEAACRSGECSLCRVRVLKGEVHEADEAKPRLCDKQYGYVHSCVSYPLTDVELDV